MIGQLAQIAKIDALLANLKTTQFNALLPVSIHVVEKQTPDQYLLQIGNKEMPTKTTKELEVGGAYWGVLKEDPKLSAVSLSQLVKKPKMLQNQNLHLLPRFNDTQLAEILSRENPKAELKAMLLERLTGANSKSEFMTLAQTIAALNENVFTMVLQEGERENVFQFKKRKSARETMSQEEGTIDFYAAFEHLGPIEGVISLIDDTKKVTLDLYYENAWAFLKNELTELGFEAVLNHKNSSIEPLFQLQASLLDIKG